MPTEEGLKLIDTIATMFKISHSRCSGWGGGCGVWLWLLLEMRLVLAKDRVEHSQCALEILVDKICSMVVIDGSVCVCVNVVLVNQNYTKTLQFWLIILISFNLALPSIITNYNKLK